MSKSVCTLAIYHDKKCVFSTLQLRRKLQCSGLTLFLRVLPGAAMRPQMAGGTTGCPGAEEGTISNQYEHRCFCSLRDPQGRNSERDWKIASTREGNTSPLTGLRGTQSGRQKLTHLMIACHRTCLFIPGMAAYIPYMYTVTQPQKMSVCVNRFPGTIVGKSS